MSADQLSHIASVLADRTRARFCLALMDGREWSAGELAAAAGVAASTASEHLGRMLAAGLITERRQGRHRYVRIASSRVAACVEDLASIPDPGLDTDAGGGLAASSKKEALARGRTCYDHLAGRLGVAVTAALGRRGLLGPDLAVTPAGRAWWSETLEPIPTGRRAVSRSCLDWTERRPHLAGASGAVLCRTFFDRGWITRIGTDRAVRTTAAGRAAVRTLLDLDLDAVWSSR